MGVEKGLFKLAFFLVFLTGMPFKRNTASLNVHVQSKPHELKRGAFLTRLQSFRSCLIEAVDQMIRINRLMAVALLLYGVQRCETIVSASRRYE